MCLNNNIFGTEFVGFSSIQTVLHIHSTMFSLSLNCLAVDEANSESFYMYFINFSQYRQFQN